MQIGNVYHQSAMDAIHRQMASDSNWAVTAIEYVQLLDELFWGQPWQDVIYQSNRDSQTTIYDAIGLGFIHAMLCEGKVGVLKMELPDTPHSNSSVMENKRLVETLPEPFCAQYFGNSADADGHLAWTDTLMFQSKDGNQDEVTPRQIPLEIGTTNVWTTWGHLTYHGGVARVPYGSSDIHVLVTIL